MSVYTAHLPPSLNDRASDNTIGATLVRRSVSQQNAKHMGQREKRKKEKQARQGGDGKEPSEGGPGVPKRKEKKEKRKTRWRTISTNDAMHTKACLRSQARSRIEKGHGGTAFSSGAKCVFRQAEHPAFYVTVVFESVVCCGR